MAARRSLWPVGKIKLIPPPESIKLIDLWSERPKDTEGRLRLRDVCRTLDGDVIAYLDEDGFEVHISAHDEGPLKGLSTDVFKCDQELVVISKKMQGVGTTSSLLGEKEEARKLLGMRKRLKDHIQEMDEPLEKLCKLRVNLSASGFHV